jgi:hypothetical protein
MGKLEMHPRFWPEILKGRSYVCTYALVGGVVLKVSKIEGEKLET